MTRIFDLYTDKWKANRLKALVRVFFILLSAKILDFFYITFDKTLMSWFTFGLVKQNNISISFLLFLLLFTFVTSVYTSVSLFTFERYGYFTEIVEIFCAFSTG